MTIIHCLILAYRFRRLACVLRRHRHWEREGMLQALATGKSKRCPRCNRLVLKKRYR